MKTRMIIRRENGTAAIEFAIILPLLLLLVFGIIEFSLLLYNKAMITNASREGARAGVVYHYDDKNTTTKDDDTYHPGNATIEAKVAQYLQARLMTFGDPQDTTPVIRRYTIDDTVTPPTRTLIDEPSWGQEEAGDSLEVTVTHEYSFLVPLLDVFGPIINQAVTEMRFE